ncbi:MAG: response regulator [Sphingomonas sp.]|nr:MAG: response regulator [Sphingomonas sp.]
MTEASLQDRRVLIVEDEYMIAEAMSRGLRRAGATVLGPVANVAAALALLRKEKVDSAVLDINLGDQKVYPVVDALLAQGARCVFATGNDPAEIPATYASMRRCEKPVDSVCLVQALNEGIVTVATLHGDKRHNAVADIQAQLLQSIQLAELAGETLLAAKLCEALDVAQDALTT